MPVRVYETADGETITENIYLTKPVVRTKYVTRYRTVTVDAQKVKLVPVYTRYMTTVVTPTKFVTVEIGKPVYKTRIVTVITSKVARAPKKEEVPPVKEPGGERYNTPSVPRGRKEETISV